MAIDTLAKESSDEKDQKEETTFTLDILQLIKDAQQQHGLRHGDYQRYRSYCTRRIRRLRKSLHFVQSNKHRFQQKKITVELLSDIRYLYIPLMMTERAWGYAMQLKQESNTEPRKRFHLVNRLRKASTNVDMLELLCQSPRCDARTKLEAQAYSAWIKGSLDFELSKWQTAMEYFSKAQTIYGKLSGALNEDERLLYEQRVDELTPNIRYCAYNIGDESAIDDLMKMRLSGKGGHEDSLLANLDHLIGQTREKQAATLSEVNWLGRNIPVRQEKVRVFLLNAQECQEEVNKSPDLDAKVGVYERLLMECKDVLQLLRDELKTDQSFRSRVGPTDVPITSLHFLHSYLSYIRLTKTVERNLLMIEALKQQMGAQKEKSPSPGETAKKPAKPQDFIRPFEIIIQNMTEITQLPGVDTDPDMVESVMAEILAYKAHKCFYLGLTYSGASKWTEALALYQRAGEYCTEAKSAGNMKNKKLLQSVKDLESNIESQKYHSHALSILGTDQTSTEQIPSLQDKKFLVDRLDEFHLDPSLTSKSPLVSNFPPDFHPIPCKPLFFDLALNHLEFPSLEEKIEQKKGGGITGLVKGWLGGWK